MLLLWLVLAMVGQVLLMLPGLVLAKGEHLCNLLKGRMLSCFLLMNAGGSVYCLV
jgi:hypothetical protein